MWSRFSGRSFAELYAFPSPVIHLPRYPSYGENERRAGDYDYFYLRSHRYRSCQAARFMLFGGDMMTLADEAAVDLTADVSGYWSGFFREHFPESIGEIVRYRGAKGYREFILDHPGYRVLTPHPFDSSHIPAERFYLDDPDLVVRLNDKGRIAELTSHVIHAEILEPEDFERGRWRERWPLPFVLKLTEASGGGDGVVLCSGENDVNEARHRFHGRRVKVEQWIHDVRNNFNVQLRVTPQGEIACIGGSVQKVSQGRYGGNLMGLDWQPPAAVSAICDQVVKAAVGLGWYGVCGLDVIEDETGAMYMIDPNFRLNGSTPFFFLGDYLASRHQAPQLSTGYFCYPGTPAELFDRFRREIHLRQLAPVGAYYDPREDGMTRIYAALVSDADPEQHATMAAAFARRSLLPGIRL